MTIGAHAPPGGGMCRSAEGKVSNLYRKGEKYKWQF